MSKPEAMLTLDVEDWDHANFSQLKGQESAIASDVRAQRYRMEANTDRWIEVLGRAGARSTCFVLGEYAKRFPEAVKRLAQAGHEIASHGATHDLVYEMSQSDFREFLKKGIGALGDLLGKRPLGFRAPSWSVDERTPWVFEELEGQGIRYDSSVFPVKTPLFGQKNSRLEPHWAGRILRVPVTVLTIGPARLPFASGAFFRLSPLAIIRLGLHRAAKRGLPVMVVLHPRELDPGHPRLPLKGWESSVHYARLPATLPKLEALLPEFDWKPIAELFADKIAAGSA
jgi:polysaccharide deacetylase family protein (PEP-CTERM system associated)